jgi:hypothetical protein
VGKINIPPPAKLIVGLIYRDSLQKEKVLWLLKKRFGEIDYSTVELPFDYTSYYYPEFGRPLKRIFISFKRLFPQDSLSGIKAYANVLEKRLSIKGRRGINIDPGLLSLGKLILATTKDHAHRLYFGKGIFGEVTLFFQGGTFRPWQWTYPDYCSKEYIGIFNAIRKIYQQQIRNGPKISKSLPGRRAQGESG